MKIFGIADTHFSHENIIKYCDRPFSNIKEMDNQLIKNWNNVVNPKDYVLHFGDLKFYTFDRMNELNGKIILFSVNYDNFTKFFLIIVKTLSFFIVNVYISNNHYDPNNFNDYYFRM